LQQKIIVSLTTIPSRVKFLRNTLKSIEKQSIKPFSIELNIPYTYRRSDIGDIDLTQIPEGFNIHRCEDFGPATKLIPTLERHVSDDTLIIYCDDDRIYDKDWIKRLVRTYNKHKNYCIYEEGSELVNHCQRLKKNWLYRCKRFLSLSLWKPTKKTHNADIVEGFGGVLVTPDMFDSTVSLIPECFFYVDDIWFSAKLAQSGIKTKWTGNTGQTSRPVIENGTDIGRLAGSLSIAKFDGKKRKQLDLTAITYATEYMHVWNDKIKISVK